MEIREKKEFKKLQKWFYLWDPPFDLAFFTGFASMPSNDLFLLGTPFERLR